MDVVKVEVINNFTFKDPEGVGLDDSGSLDPPGRPLWVPRLQTKKSMCNPKHHQLDPVSCVGLRSVKTEGLRLSNTI